MPADKLNAIQTAKDALLLKGPQYDEYMRVVLNGQTFLIAVKSVLSVLRPVPLTHVPMAPDHLMGVANIRGQVFCLIDPGKILRIVSKRKEATAASRYLLLRHPRVHLGVWAEEVLDLHRIESDVVIEDEGLPFELGKLATRHGLLPVLRVSALFD